MTQALVIEGWLDYAQSFAVIAGNHLLELRSRAGLEVMFRELPPPARVLAAPCHTVLPAAGVRRPA